MEFFKIKVVAYDLKLKTLDSSSPVVFPSLKLDYCLLMNLKISMLFSAGSIATSNIEERYLLDLWLNREKTSKEFTVPAMQMNSSHE